MSCKSWSSTVASSRAGARVYKHPCPCDCFGYKTLIDVSILTILTKTIDIHETKSWPKGKVIFLYTIIKKQFGLKTMNGWLDLDDAYTYDQYQWLVVFSETRAQQSRPVESVAWLYKHLCPCDRLDYNHEQVIGSWWTYTYDWWHVMRSRVMWS